MRLVFDDGTLLLEDAPETVPYAEWDDRVDEFRAPAQQYREIREGLIKGTDRQPSRTRQRRHTRLPATHVHIRISTSRRLSLSSHRCTNHPSQHGKTTAVVEALSSRLPVVFS